MIFIKKRIWTSKSKRLQGFRKAKAFDCIRLDPIALRQPASTVDFNRKCSGKQVQSDSEVVNRQKQVLSESENTNQKARRQLGQLNSQFQIVHICQSVCLHFQFRTVLLQNFSYIYTSETFEVHSSGLLFVRIKFLEIFSLSKIRIENSK